MTKTLDKFSIGVGDRFARQAKAQLQACVRASQLGVNIIPVWNKSNREHAIIGSEPVSVRAAADNAVEELGWNLPYFCDADHITLATVDRFLSSCDFYTIDVAEFLGKRFADASSVDRFIAHHPELVGPIRIECADESIDISPSILQHTAEKFLPAVQEAGKVFRYIEAIKGRGAFISEISIDETDLPLGPAELLIVLAAIADEDIPIQTIAPKFSGRFNKGVDYVDDISQFHREVNMDIAVIEHAIMAYSLPNCLKLSVHSGSDKFSIYPSIFAAIRDFSTGVHLKTAGTTWLEEITGLAETGGDCLTLAKEIYAQAFAHRAELCAPYATVIDIDSAGLPLPATVAGWSSVQFTAALRNDPRLATYNRNLRQLLHVGFKVAATLGSRYLDLVDSNQEIIAKNVTENLFARHIAPVFFGYPVKYSAAN